MNQIRIGKAKNQGKPGDTIAVEINGKTVEKKAGNEINSTKVVVVGDTVLSGSSPVEKRSQSNIQRKRKKKKSVTATYPVKILAVVENEEEEVYEFWLYGDRKSPKKIYELDYYNPDSEIPQNEMTGRYIDTATIYNSGKKESDYLIFIKWYDYELPVNPPQEILDIDPTVEGYLGGYQAILISNSKQVPITQYVDYLRQTGDRLTIFPDDYISPAVGVIYNDYGFDAENENIEVLYEWPKHGDTVAPGDSLNLWVINDLLSEEKLITPPSSHFSLGFEPLSIAETLAFLNPISKGSDFISTIQSPSISSFEIEAISGTMPTAYSIGSPYIYFEWASDDSEAEIHNIVGSFYRGWSDLFTSADPFLIPSLVIVPAHSIKAINANNLKLNISYPLRQELLSSTLSIPLLDPLPSRYGGGDGFIQIFTTSQTQNGFLGMVLFTINNLEPIELELAIASSFMDVEFNKRGNQVLNRYLSYTREFINTTVDFFGVSRTYFLNILQYGQPFAGGIRFLYWSKIDIPFLLIKGNNSFILGRWHGIYYFDGETEDTREYSYSLFQIVEGEIIEQAIADFSVLEKDGKLNLDQHFTLKGSSLYEVIEDSKLTNTLNSKTKVHVKSYLINDQGVVEDKGIKTHEVLPLKKEAAQIWSASFF